jgi:hypothetical protein
MRTVLTPYLQPPGTTTYEVESCSVDMVRQSAARCLLQYAVHLRNIETGEARREIITGVAYNRDRVQRVWERIRSSGVAIDRPMPGSGLLPVALVPDLQLLLQVFPFDHRLPGLFRLNHDPPEEVVSIVLDQFGPGEWRLENWGAETVRYHVDMRAMVRLDVQALERTRNQSSGLRLYAKVYPEADMGAEAFAIQHRLWQYAAEDAAPFAVARPVAWLPDLQTLLLGEVTGTSLLDLLRQRDEALPALDKTAQAFAALHQLPLVDFLTERSRDVRDEDIRLDRLAGSIMEAAPNLAPLAYEVVAAIRANPGEPILGPTHFDLKPGHILLDGQHVTLLDFDKLQAADPLVDVASFAVNLGKIRAGNRRHPGKARATMDAFIADYFSRVPAEWFARFPPCYATALLAEAVNSGRGQHGRGQRSDRLDRMEMMVKEAHETMKAHRW